MKKGTCVHIIVYCLCCGPKDLVQTGQDFIPSLKVVTTFSKHFCVLELHFWPPYSKYCSFNFSIIPTRADNVTSVQPLSQHCTCSKPWYVQKGKGCCINAHYLGVSWGHSEQKQIWKFHIAYYVFIVSGFLLVFTSPLFPSNFPPTPR